MYKIRSYHYRDEKQNLILHSLSQISQTNSASNHYHDEEEHLPQFILNFSSLVLPRSVVQSYCHQRFLDLKTERASNYQLRGVQHLDRFGKSGGTDTRDACSRVATCTECACRAVLGVNVPNLHNSCSTQVLCRNAETIDRAPAPS